MQEMNRRNPLTSIKQKNKRKAALLFKRAVFCGQIRRKRVCLQFFLNKFQLISEIRSLSADSLPSLLPQASSGVSASQLFGRSVADFFNLKRISFHRKGKNSWRINNSSFLIMVRVNPFRSSFCTKLQYSLKKHTS